jgi:hypothetical protein
MSLNVAKLEMVRKLEGGLVRARCPTCAEAGLDRASNHLRILGDGRFGCCVHPKDRDHRKLIFALAGCKLHLQSAGTFTVRVVSGEPTISASQSVKAALTASRLGTLGTGKTDCKTGVPSSSVRELGWSPTGAVERLPFLTADGTLSIPFDSPERYHWWKSGQSVATTRAEVLAQMEATTVG